MNTPEYRGNTSQNVLRSGPGNGSLFCMWFVLQSLILFLNTICSADEVVLQLLKNPPYDYQQITADYSSSKKTLQWFVRATSEDLESSKKTAGKIGLPLKGVMASAGYKQNQESYRRFRESVKSGSFFSSNTSWRYQFRSKKVSEAATRVVIEYLRTKSRGAIYYATVDPNNSKRFTLHVSFHPIGSPRSGAKQTAKLTGKPFIRGARFLRSSWPREFGNEGYEMPCYRDSDESSVYVSLNFDVKSSGSLFLPGKKKSSLGTFWLESTKGRANGPGGMDRYGWAFDWRLAGKGSAWPGFWQGKVWYYPNLKWKGNSNGAWSTVRRIVIQLDGKEVYTMRRESDFRHIADVGIPQLTGSTKGIYGNFGSGLGESQSWVANAMRDWIKHNGSPLHDLVNQEKTELRLRVEYKNGESQTLQVK